MWLNREADRQTDRQQMHSYEQAGGGVVEEGGWWVGRIGQQCERSIN